MNIGIYIKLFTGGAAGISKYVTGILDELQRIDNENHYYLFECKKSDYAPTNPNWKKIVDFTKLPGIVWMQLTLPKLIKKYNIDVYWAPDQICPVFGGHPRVKMVTTIYDFVIRRYPETCQPSNLLINKLLLGATIKKSDALLPISEFTKNEMLHFYPYLKSAPKIIKVVNCGTINPAYEASSEERENFLFFAGSLEPRKNLHRLIKALEIVNASGFELDLHICGPKGWKNSNFHELVRSSPIRDRVKHLGYVSDAELMDQYRKCKAVIFPSIYEGFGLPALEALKVGTQVLTSKGTPMEEIAGTNAIYFDPCDVGSIAEAIIGFLRNGPIPINRRELDKYNFNRSAEKLLEVFAEVANS